MHTPADVEAAIAASADRPIVIFKHSATCPFSAAAQVEVANAKHDLDIYGIVVQYAGDLSKLIAERLSVEHASPQAIVVHRGEPVGHYWRGEIQEGALKTAIADLP